MKIYHILGLEINESISFTVDFKINESNSAYSLNQYYISKTVRSQRFLFLSFSKSPRDCNVITLFKIIQREWEIVGLPEKPKLITVSSNNLLSSYSSKLDFAIFYKTLSWRLQSISNKS